MWDLIIVAGSWAIFGLLFFGWVHWIGL